MEPQISPLRTHQERWQRQDIMPSPLNFSTHMRRPIRRSSLRSKASTDNGTSVSQMTPPQTPPHYQHQQERERAASRLRSRRPRTPQHYYLRALYSFNPEADDHTARIDSGDLIFVHHPDRTGWADGTVLRTRQRGWVPTNYCETFDHPFMKGLLDATTKFYELLVRWMNASQGIVQEDEDDEDDEYDDGSVYSDGRQHRRRDAGDLMARFVRRQDYIRELVAGVRALLQNADCLRRDADLVLKHHGIRRMRKGVLADLSNLVEIAKNLQSQVALLRRGKDGDEEGEEEDQDEMDDRLYENAQVEQVVHELLAELMGKAFKVVTRAVGFLDMWTMETEEARSAISLADTPAGDWGAVATESVAGSSVTHEMETANGAASLLHPANESEAEQQQQQERIRSVSNERKRSEDAAQEWLQRRRISRTYSGKRLSTRFRPQSTLMSHRVSMTPEEPEQVSSLASKQLDIANKDCVSRVGGYVGTFVGCRLPSRESDELSNMTGRLSEACERLVGIINRVVEIASDEAKIAEIIHAKVEVKDQLIELFDAAQNVLQSIDAPENGIVVILQSQSEPILTVGTKLIRKVFDCVAKTQSLIEEMGDFDLNQPSPQPQQQQQQQHPLRAPSPQPQASLARATVTVAEEEKDVAVFNQKEEQQSSEPSTEKPSETTLRPSLSLHTRSASHKALPPLPPPVPSPTRARALTSIGVTDFASMPSPSVTIQTIPTPVTPASSVDVAKTLPPVPAPAAENNLAVPSSESLVIEEDGPKGAAEASFSTTSASPVRKTSFGTSMSGSTDTPQNSARDSGITTVSEVSTRATTPEHSSRETANNDEEDKPTMKSVESMSSLQSAAAEMVDSDVVTAEPAATTTAEEKAQPKSYAHELMYKDGQIVGGSLPALVERLTLDDAAPDAQFMSAFFITFRSFTTPRELVEVLIARFDYAGSSASVVMRISNFFKHWLETYWHGKNDRDALDGIRFFAVDKLTPVIKSLGERLLERTCQVAAADAAANSHTRDPLVSGIGKMNTAVIDPSRAASVPTPPPEVTKSQLALLRNALNKGDISRSASFSSAANAAIGPSCTILDFEPIELARQLTIMASTVFAKIQPSELLSMAWNKKDSTEAMNVRHVSRINSDLGNFVADSILSYEDAKKRALFIKQWSKIASHALEMNNYEAFLSINASLNSSAIRRLKRTWDNVSKKTKARLAALNEVMDFSRNQATLRRKFEQHQEGVVAGEVAASQQACLPYLGIFLTDLTFIDQGNPNMRELPIAPNNSSNDDKDQSAAKTIKVINFDKQVRRANIIKQIQKFQAIPYHLSPVLEMQSWLEAQLSRMRPDENNATSGAGGSASSRPTAPSMEQRLHRRSLVVEPKDVAAVAQAAAHNAPPMPSMHSLLRVPTASSSSLQKLEQRHASSEKLHQQQQQDRSPSAMGKRNASLSAASGVASRSSSVAGPAAPTAVVDDTAIAMASTAATPAADMIPPPPPRPKTASGHRADTSPSPAVAAKFEAFAKSALGLRRSEEKVEH